MGAFEQPMCTKALFTATELNNLNPKSPIAIHVHQVAVKFTEILAARNFIIGGFVVFREQPLLQVGLTIGGVGEGLIVLLGYIANKCRLRVLR